MKKCVIDERELYDGKMLWIVIDESSGEEIKEFFESNGHDEETARIWAKSNGYENIGFI